MINISFNVAFSEYLCNILSSMKHRFNIITNFLRRLSSVFVSDEIKEREMSWARSKRWKYTFKKNMVEKTPSVDRIILKLVLR